VPCWSPTTFTNSKRCKANALQINALVFDMDDGLTAFDTWRLFGDWAVIAHTSFSHKPHWHKYRIVLPLAKPIPAMDWGRASMAANELWADVVTRGVPDQSAINDNARAYYRYTHPNGMYNDKHPMHVAHYHKTAVHITKPLLDLDYSHIKEPATQHAAKIRQTELRGSNVKTMDMALLDPNVRTSAALALGAQIQGNTARGIHCPQCQQPEVYFSIHTDVIGAVIWPRCNRQNKCQWYGALSDLL